MKNDRFRPDAAARRVSPPDPARMSGNRADRVIVDDPLASIEVTQTCPICARTDRHEHAQHVLDEVRARARRFFVSPEPIAQNGRNSIPKSHRGEGLNYVD